MSTNRVKGQTVSLVVPTRDRGPDIQRFLVSLARQSRPPEELIIVDQSSGSDTHEITSRLTGALHSTRLVYVHDPDIRGVSQARNVGIEASTGHLIGFFDDDVVLEDDCLEQLLVAISRNPDLTGVGAVERQLESLGRTHLMFYDTFFVGPFRDEKYGMSRRWRTMKDLERVGALKTCGALFRREYVARYGFDERWRAALLEDLDLCWQGGELARFGLSRRAGLTHYHSVTPGVSASTYRNLGAAWVFFFQKNRRRRRGASAAFPWLVCGLLLRSAVASVEEKSIAPVLALGIGLLSAARPTLAAPSIDILSSAKVHRSETIGLDGCAVCAPEGTT